MLTKRGAIERIECSIDHILWYFDETVALPHPHSAKALRIDLRLSEDILELARGSAVPTTRVQVKLDAVTQWRVGCSCWLLVIR